MPAATPVIVRLPTLTSPLEVCVAVRPYAEYPDCAPTVVAELLPIATLLALLTVAPVPIAIPLTTDVVAPLPKAMELVAPAEVTAVCPIAID